MHMRVCACVCALFWDKGPGQWGKGIKIWGGEEGSKMADAGRPKIAEMGEAKMVEI